MRTTIRSVALVAAVLAVASGVASAQAQPVKIAYVNPQALFENAPGRADAEATFQKETQAYRAELSKMNDRLTQMMSDYQKGEKTFAAAQKEQKQRAITALEDTLRARQAALEQQANQRQNELMAPIMETVRKVLEDIRAEDGYAMILSSEPGSSPILAADKNLDVTDRVVARLKTVAATKPATTTPAKPAAGAPANAPTGVTRPKPPGSDPR